MGKKKKKYELEDANLVLEKSAGGKKKKKKKKDKTEKDKKKEKKKDKKKKDKVKETESVVLNSENVGFMTAEIVPDIGDESYDDAMKDDRTLIFVMSSDDASMAPLVVVRTPNKSFMDIMTGNTVANIAKEKGLSKVFKTNTKFRPVFISTREFIDGFAGGKYK